jgi:outer membrane protein TolC
MQSRVALVLLAFIAMPSLAAAQAMRLGFVDALRRGAADPPAVRAALARASVAAAQVSLAEAAYLPSIGFSANGNASYNNFFRRTTGLVIAGRDVEQVNEGSSFGLGVNASADVRMTLYDFGRTSNNVRAAERASLAARADTQLARAQAAGAIASAYLAVLSDAEAIAAARATLAQREAHLRIAEGLVTVGTRPPIDRTRAEVNLDVARLDLTAAEARAESDRATLAAALGIDPLRGVEVEPVDEVLLRIDDDLAHAADAAVRTRPELAGARARLAQAEAQAAAVRAGRLPTLAASAGASVQLNQIIGNGVGTTGNSEAIQAGVTLSWPAFDPAVRANVRVSESSVITARETLAQQSLQVRAAAVQAAINARAARVSLTQSERLAVNAAATLDMATGRYQSGAAALLELIDAQAADAGARIAVVRARLAWQLARVNLLVATGEIERLMGDSRPR